MEVEPAGAQVRILNFPPPFRQGMRLNPGRYQLEIAAAGRHPYTGWVEVEPGEKEVGRVSLQPVAAASTSGDQEDRDRVRSQWLQRIKAHEGAPPTAAPEAKPADDQKEVRRQWLEQMQQHRQ